MNSIKNRYKLKKGKKSYNTVLTIANIVITLFLGIAGLQLSYTISKGQQNVKGIDSLLRLSYADNKRNHRNIIVTNLRHAEVLYNSIQLLSMITTKYQVNYEDDPTYYSQLKNRINLIKPIEEIMKEQVSNQILFDNDTLLNELWHVYDAVTLKLTLCEIINDPDYGLLEDDDLNTCIAHVAKTNNVLCKYCLQRIKEFKSALQVSDTTTLRF